MKQNLFYPSQTSDHIIQIIIHNQKVVQFSSCETETTSTANSSNSQRKEELLENQFTVSSFVVSQKWESFRKINSKNQLNIFLPKKSAIVAS